ncbi:hypothetical protein DFH07DRAFT_782788 [Mycena maculata]|uniref:Uncharacterized protein n=1 Tax=Mycena maculata TaxID=230809 RepID=A0AAD7HSC6_9AGAR|nr:hypothetical protein DFH07DRAFT_782788 [Mycena maculata]
MTIALERDHKNRCHLFEGDRKLSTIFAKSLGPGTVNDPTLSLSDKVIQWNFLNTHNHNLIASAALKNDPNIAKTFNVGIFLRLVENRIGSNYDHRTFIIDQVWLFARDASNKFAKETEWVKGNVPHTDVASDPPPGWVEYAWENHTMMSGLKGQSVMGIERPDGTRVPIYKWSMNGHFRRCAPGELADTGGPEESNKPLIGSSRMARMITEWLDHFTHVQNVGLGMSEKKWGGSAPEQRNL